MKEILFVMRTLADCLPELPNAIYLFGETSDNQCSVLDRAAELYHKNPTLVCIPGLDWQLGYPGEISWRAELELQGVSNAQIVSIALPDKSHTHIEAIELIHYAKKNAWDQIIVVAPAFHLPRCFLDTISVVLREYPGLRVYACPGKYLNWDEVATHSQGILRSTRSQLVAAELERIQLYTQKGDLAPVAKALEYLSTRG